MRQIVRYTRRQTNQRQKSKSVAKQKDHNVSIMSVLHWLNFMDSFGHVLYGKALWIQKTRWTSLQFSKNIIQQKYIFGYGMHFLPLLTNEESHWIWLLHDNLEVFVNY